VTNSPLNRLVDILVEVPGLLEDLDVLRQASNPTEIEKLYNNLMEKCRTCEIALSSWETAVGPILKTYDYIIIGETLPTPRNDDDLAIIYLSCYYWMTWLLVLSTKGFTELEASPTPTLMSCPSQILARSYAYRIAPLPTARRQLHRCSSLLPPRQRDSISYHGGDIRWSEDYE